MNFDKIECGDLHHIIQDSGMRFDFCKMLNTIRTQFQMSKNFITLNFVHQLPEFLDPFEPTPVPSKSDPPHMLPSTVTDMKLVVQQRQPDINKETI